MTSSAPVQALAPAPTEPRRENGRGRLLVLFGIYLLLLTWIVVWKLELPHSGTGGPRQIKLIPFAPSAEAGASDPAEVLANIALFAPFGVYLALLAPRWPWWNAAAMFAGVSLAFEATQYALAVGSADSSDVIANTAGGLAGIVLLAMARRSPRARTAAVVKQVCAIGTALALLAVGIFVASPLRFTQPDVRVSSSQTPGAELTPLEPPRQAAAP